MRISALRAACFLAILVSVATPAIGAHAFERSALFVATETAVYDVTGGGDFSNATPFIQTFAAAEGYPTSSNGIHSLLFTRQGVLYAGVGNNNPSLGSVDYTRGAIANISNGVWPDAPINSGYHNERPWTLLELAGGIGAIDNGYAQTGALPHRIAPFLVIDRLTRPTGAVLLKGGALFVSANDNEPFADQAKPGSLAPGVYDVSVGGRLVNAKAFVTGMVRAVDIVEFRGRLLLATAAGIVDISLGGDVAAAPKFATGNFSRMIVADDRLLAATATGRIYDVTFGGAFGPAVIVSGLPPIVGLAYYGHCGDAIVQNWEVCDAGVNTAECDEDCSVPLCGDMVFNPIAGEYCDHGNYGSATCDSDCTLVTCGDGLTNELASEQCDDGNNVDGDGCSSVCELESSGVGATSGATGGGQGDPDDCGCTTSGTSTNGSYDGAWFPMLLALFALRRRRDRLGQPDIARVNFDQSRSKLPCGGKQPVPLPKSRGQRSLASTRVSPIQTRPYSGGPA